MYLPFEFPYDFGHFVGSEEGESSSDNRMTHLAYTYDCLKSVSSGITITSTSVGCATPGPGKRQSLLVGCSCNLRYVSPAAHELASNCSPCTTTAELVDRDLVSGEDKGQHSIALQ